MGIGARGLIMGRLSGRGVLWASVFLFFLWALVVPRPVDPYDYWEHLVSGLHTLETGQVLDREVYASETRGQPLVNMYWLTQLVYAGLFRLGGVELTVTVHGLAVLASWGAMMLWLRRRGHEGTVAAFSVFTGIALTLRSTALRPQLLAGALGPLLLMVLRRDRAAWFDLSALFGLMAIWAGLHPGFTAALGIVGIEGAALVLGAPSARRKRALATAFLWSGAALAGTLANPHGPWLHLHILEAAANPVMRDNAEWMPPAVDSLLGHTLILSTLYLLIRSPRLSWSDLRAALTPAVLLLMTLVSSRFSLWYAVALPPLVARLMPGTGGNRGTRPPLNLALVLVLAGMALWMTPWFKSSCPFLPPNRRSLLAAETPDGLARFALERGRDLKWFHAAEWGDYLLWIVRGRHDVFMYCRFDRFPQDLWRDYLTASGASQGWQEVLDRRGIDLCILSYRHQGRLLDAMSRSPRWRLLHADALGAVFERAVQRETPPPEDVPPG